MSYFVCISKNKNNKTVQTMDDAQGIVYTFWLLVFFCVFLYG